MMTFAELIVFINAWVKENHNNEITGDILNSVLQAMATRPEDVVGDLANLGTTNKSNIVNAINEINAALAPSGVQLYTGTENPNLTPPVSFNYADFYMQVTGLNAPILLYQYDGYRWVPSTDLYLGGYATEAELESSRGNVVENMFAFIETDGVIVSVAFYNGTDWIYTAIGGCGFGSLQEMYDADPTKLDVEDLAGNKSSIRPNALLVYSVASGAAVGIIDVSGALALFNIEDEGGGAFSTNMQVFGSNGDGSIMYSKGNIRIGVNPAGFGSNLRVDNITVERDNQMPNADGTLALSAKIGATSYPADTAGAIDLTGAVDGAGSAAAAESAANAYTDSEISAAVVGLLDDRGNYDASSNLFPSTGGSGTAGAILKGDLWTISVAGTLGGVAVTIGDVVRALVDTPAQTAANWVVTENNIGYVPENASNKSTSVTTDQASNIKFPSVKSVFDWATGLFQTISALAADVRAVVLTGLSTASAAAVTSSDSLLVAIGKLQAQITAKKTDTFLFLSSPTNLVDATTYYFVTTQSILPTSGGKYTIAQFTTTQLSWAVSIGTTSGGSGSSENAVMTLYNITQATSIVLSSTMKTDAFYTGFTGSGAFAISPNDALEVRILTPTYSANPNGVAISVRLIATN